MKFNIQRKEQQRGRWSSKNDAKNKPLQARYFYLKGSIRTRSFGKPGVFHVPEAGLTGKG